MPISYRFKRAMAIDRRERAVRLAQLRHDIRTFAFWRRVVSRYVLPVAVVLFIGFSFGAVWGMTYLAEKAREQFICEPRHVD